MKFALFSNRDGDDVIVNLDNVVTARRIHPLKSPTVITLKFVDGSTGDIVTTWGNLVGWTVNAGDGGESPPAS